MAWWFFLIIGLVIITLIYLFIRIRLDRIKNKKEELQRVVNEKTREVVQQRDEIAEIKASAIKRETHRGRAFHRAWTLYRQEIC